MSTATAEKTTTTIEVETSIVTAIAEAKAARDAGIAQAESSERAAYDSALLDQALRAFAETGRPFSANDLRNVLPDDIHGPLWGARFTAARCRGDIRPVGDVTSTKKNTHAKPVALWVGTGVAPDGDPA